MIHYVYRMYAWDGRLLYVGRTYRPGQRMQAHASLSHWWAATTHVTFRAYTDQAEAREVEIDAIRQDFPAYNVAHRSKVHPRRYYSHYDWFPGSKSVDPHDLRLYLARREAERLEAA
jgi:excinuclease UvrABC nuclease subunit